MDKKRSVPFCPEPAGCRWRSFGSETWGKTWSLAIRSMEYGVVSQRRSFQLPKVLSRWAKHLKSDGWLVVTEVDDLFGHEPIAVETKTLLNAYAEGALAAGRYDFRMGRKLERHLLQAGFLVSKTFTLTDQELAFNGCAQPEVPEAWRDRFARMGLLRHFCGEKMGEVEEDFLKCLGRDDHRSLASVYCCIARKSRPG